MMMLVLTASSHGQEPRDVDVLATSEHIVTGRYQLVKADSEFLVFETSEPQEFVIRRDELVWWNAPLDSQEGSRVQLSGGSVICGSVSSIGNQQLEITGKLWQPVQVPSTVVRQIELQIPANRELRRRQQEWLEQAADRDRILMTSGDSLAGEILPSESQAHVHLQSDAGSYHLPVEQISAISFEIRKAGRPSSARYEYDLCDGSRLRVTEINFDQEQIAAVCDGIPLVFKRNTQQKEYDSTAMLVCGFRNLAYDGKYLSSFRPVEYRQTPLLGPKTDYQVNRDVTGDFLQVRDRVFPFGLGMPSRSSLVFQIEEPTEELKLQFGVCLDPSADKTGSVTCKILKLNQQNQWLETWVSPELNGDSDAVFETIPLEDAKAIALTVDYAKNADVLDRVNWLMPRLIR